MGDRRGYYFPRIRKPGKYMLTATKEGADPYMEFFDTTTFMTRRQLQLEKQGYKVSKDKAPKLSEDVFQMAGKVVGINAMLNEALNRTQSEKLKLEDFGLTVNDKQL